MELHNVMTDGADEPIETSPPTGPPAAAAGRVDSVPGPFFEGTDWLALGLTSLVLLAIYWRTLAPSVTVGDSGMLSTGAPYAGVPRPPGYPVWTLYSWLFVELLPFGDVAWRVAAGSAVASALACGLLALVVSSAGPRLWKTAPLPADRRLAGQKPLRIICGCVAGMALGLSRTVWQLAVVPETWGLTLLLFTAMLCLLKVVGGIVKDRPAPPSSGPAAYDVAPP